MRYFVSGALALLLTACGAAGNTQAVDSPGTTSSASVSASAATTATAAGSLLNPQAFCSFLISAERRMKTDGSIPGPSSVADFGLQLANWIDTHRDQKPRTAADLDVASERTCPKPRAEILQLLKAPTFDAALG